LEKGRNVKHLALQYGMGEQMVHDLKKEKGRINFFCILVEFLKWTEK
jgi:hypothetical protein